MGHAPAGGFPDLTSEVRLPVERRSIARVRAVLTAAVAAGLLVLALPFGLASPPSYDEGNGYLPSIAFVQARFPWVLQRSYGARSPAAPPLWFGVQASVGHILGRSPIAALPDLRVLNLVCAIGAFVLLSLGRPLAPTPGGAALAVLAISAAMFGGPMLLDVFRIKPLFPGWLLAAPVILSLRPGGEASRVEGSAVRRSAGMLLMALTFWTNQVTGVVLCACAAGALIARGWPSRLLDSRARVLVALLVAGCGAGLALLLFWGGMVPASNELVLRTGPPLAPRVVAPLVTIGCVLGVWALAFLRWVPRAAVAGAVAAGLAAMFVILPHDVMYLSFVGPVGTALRQVENFSLWSGRFVQGVAVALSVLLLLGLVLGRTDDERSAGLSLTALVGLLATVPYLSDRYYVIGLGPWFVASGLTVLERQYASWGGAGRRFALVVVAAALLSGVGYAVYKLHLAYGGVVAQ